MTENRIYSPLSEVNNTNNRKEEHLNVIGLFT